MLGHLILRPVVTQILSSEEPISATSSMLASPLTQPRSKYLYYFWCSQTFIANYTYKMMYYFIQTNLLRGASRASFTQNNELIRIKGRNCESRGPAGGLCRAEQHQLFCSRHPIILRFRQRIHHGNHQQTSGIERNYLLAGKFIKSSHFQLIDPRACHVRDEAGSLCASRDRRRSIQSPFRSPS